MTGFAEAVHIAWACMAVAMGMLWLVQRHTGNVLVLTLMLAPLPVASTLAAESGRE